MEHKSPQPLNDRYQLEDFELSIKTTQVLKSHPHEEEMEKCLDNVDVTKSSESSGISSVATTDDEIQTEEEVAETIVMEVNGTDDNEHMDCEDTQVSETVTTEILKPLSDSDIKTEKAIIEELNNNEEDEKLNIDMSLQLNPYAAIHGYSFQSLKDDIKPDSDTDSALGSLVSEEKFDEEKDKNVFRPGVIVWAGYTSFDWYASIVDEQDVNGGNFLKKNIFLNL